MNEDKQKYLFELLEIVDEMGLAGTAVMDSDGTIIGIIIGEDEFIEAFDYEKDKTKILH